SSASVTAIVAFSPLPLPFSGLRPLPEPFSPSLDSLATVPTAMMCPCTVRPSGSVTGAASPTWASCCWLAFTCSCTICCVEVVPSTSFDAPSPEPLDSLPEPSFDGFCSAELFLEGLSLADASLEDPRGLEGAAGFLCADGLREEG